VNTHAVKASEINQAWFLVDANGKTLGRLASEVAKVLHGKHKPIFAPHMDTGDFVIVVNADKIHVTGRKMSDKMYYQHSGYPSGLKTRNLDEMMLQQPEKVLYLAVRGMLPKTRLGRQMIQKLKIYTGTTHPHAAQQPKPLEF
jgi:large subunit ribosomal protein L13